MAYVTLKRRRFRVTDGRMTQSISDLRQNSQKLLDSVGYPTRKINSILQVAGRVTTVLESIEAAKKNPLIQKRLLFVETILDTFIDFVVNPEKGYVFVTNRIASVSSTIAQLIALETDFPIEIRLRVQEIKYYFENVKSVMAEVDEDATKMAAMIDSACGNNFTISRTEMEQLRSAKFKLDRKLQTCEHYLDSIHEVLNMLKSDVRKQILRSGLDAADVLTTCAGLFGDAVSSASTIAKGVDIVKNVAIFTVTTVLGIGFACTFWNLLKILVNYSNLLLRDCENIKCELRKVKLEFRERKRKVEELREEMGLLD